MKHTQGEWNCDTNEGCKEIRTSIGSIAQTDGINEEEDLANAKLIAAAPEMLEALKDVLDTLDKGMTGRQHKIYKRVEQAIKKATQ